jgi:hypothetical protein
MSGDCEFDGMVDGCGELICDVVGIVLGGELIWEVDGKLNAGLCGKFGLDWRKSAGLRVKLGCSLLESSERLSSELSVGVGVSG